MRRVTLSTALVLSFFAFSMSAPAFSLPTSKERTAKVSAEATAKGTKRAAATKQQATAKQQAKKPAVAKVAAVKQPAAKQAAIKQAATKPAAKTAAKPITKQVSTKPAGKQEATKPAAKQAAVKQTAKNGAKTAEKPATKPVAKRTVEKRQVAAVVPAVQTETAVQPQPRVVRVAPVQQTVYQNYSEVAERPVSMAAQSAYASAPNELSSKGRRMPALFASSNIVDEARRWIGTNPTTRDTLWCARFMNFVLERSGYSGTNSDAAKSFASYGVRVRGPQIGAIAVMTRGKNGGHVGVVSGIDSSGNPIVISGNHGKKVGEGVYPRSRIYAYVRPL